jgi:hypothetical protein
MVFPQMADYQVLNFVMVGVHTLSQVSLKGLIFLRMVVDSLVNFFLNLV